ncbi:putative inorganic phosphate cotransporter-like protein, partial [Leptotrombidium deliense]
VLGYSIFFTSILTLLSPLAAEKHYILFVVCRAFEGLFEGVAFPAMHGMIARWLPKHERGLMSTIIYSGAAIGTVVTMAVAGVLSDSSFLGGWPSIFYVSGSVGVLWFLGWMFLIYDSPQQHPSISGNELKTILEGQGEQRAHRNVVTPWKSILTSVPVWALVIAHFGQNWGFYTLLFQLPTYFDTILGFNIKENGFLSAIPYLAQAVCGWIVSYILDSLIKRNVMKVNSVRKLSNTISTLGPAICLLAVTFAKCDSTLNVILLTLAMAINGFYYSGFNVTHVDMSPDFAGSLMGLTNCVANFAGILAPYVVGALTASEPSLLNWSYVFYISTAIYIASAAIFLMFGSAELQPWGIAKDCD